MRTILITTLLCAAGTVAAIAAHARPAGTDDTSSAVVDSLKLRGGEQGTTFGSLRIQGEDRVRVAFERPTLDLRLDPRTAPGLEWEGIHSALARGGVDRVDPLWVHTSTERPPLYVRPWLDQFQDGGVARFRPAIDKVARWEMVVGDSKGSTVARFGGKGKPPKEIVWDGGTIDGDFAPPGYTYSYVLEAFDKAGNKRNFVGESFELNAYRITGNGTVVMLFAGEALSTSGDATPPILLEAASWINRSDIGDTPIRVEVTARSYEDAKLAADRISTHLKPLILGNPLRLQTVSTVEPNAPMHGTIAITVGREASSKQTTRR